VKINSKKLRQTLQVEQQVNERVKEFLGANSAPDGGEDGIEVQRLIIDLYVIYKGAESPLEKARLQQEVIQLGKLWTSDDAALAHIQIYVNKVMTGEYNAATDYLAKAISYKESLRLEGVTHQKQKQAEAGGLARHAENNKVKAAAVIFYALNKDKYKTKKEAAVDLEARFPPLTWQTYRSILKPL